ncbi:MAG: cysteine hydrolase [Candidatus Limnocylindria bacterium]
MTPGLAELVDPAHTAIVTQECQRGVVGDLSALPELAKAARPMLANAAALVSAARAAGARVIHCTALRRADGLGANRNARIFGYMAKAKNPLLPGSPAAELVPEIEVKPSDLMLPRWHGLSPFQGTELDFLLRNLGVRTIVGVGASVNVAIQSLAFDAVNASYQVVIPRDAVAGFPPEYVEAVFAHTLGAVATLVASQELLAVWRGR